MIVMQIIAWVALLLPKLCCLASMHCALQPGNTLLHGSMMGGDTQMTASPKAPALPSTSLPPQAAHEAQALANASETLKAQAQTLKVGTSSAAVDWYLAEHDMSVDHTECHSRVVTSAISVLWWSCQSQWRWA